jgi:hypothetical protein
MTFTKNLQLIPVVTNTKMGTEKRLQSNSWSDDDDDDDDDKEFMTSAETAVVMLVLLMVRNKLSQYSVWLRTRRLGFDPRQRQRIFLLVPGSRLDLGPTQSPMQWVPGVLSPGVKRGRGVMLTTHRHLVPRLIMSRSYTSSPPSAFMACSGRAFLLRNKRARLWWPLVAWCSHQVSWTFVYRFESY